MTREIRRETDWLGTEKEIVYENDVKIGEVREERTLFGFGETVRREYNNTDTVVGETRREDTNFGFGPEVDKTYNSDGEQVSVTRKEETFFGYGPKVERTFNNDGIQVSESNYIRKYFGFGPRVKRIEQTIQDRVAKHSASSNSRVDGGFQGGSFSSTGTNYFRPRLQSYLAPILIVSGLLAISFLSHWIAFLISNTTPESILELIFKLLGIMFFYILAIPAMIVRIVVTGVLIGLGII